MIAQEEIKMPNVVKFVNIFKNILVNRVYILEKLEV